MNIIRINTQDIVAPNAATAESLPFETTCAFLQTAGLLEDKPHISDDPERSLGHIHSLHAADPTYKYIHRFLILANYKSLGMPANCPNKYAIRLANMHTLWDHLLGKYELFLKVHQLTPQFLDFFVRMTLFIYNAIFSQHNMPRTVKLLKRIANWKHRLRIALEGMVLSDALACLFKYLYKEYIAVAKPTKLHIEDYFRILISYYKRTTQENIYSLDFVSLLRAGT